ncbi:class II glutamine amidotransferase [Pseudarthrobacter sp. Fe7]|nr:class II glutamine amidotransferase [Pseudarthrobacter sp. Fe7]
MCRLFGLHAGSRPVRATFWLLDAPDSLAEQSRREPDGAGIGTFEADGGARVSKRPLAAWEDHAFAREARELRSTTFLAHVRYASTGAHTMANTHPFEQDGRLFAHNGAFHGLARLDQRLAGLGVAGLVQGQTDSERLFALITAESRRAGGDVADGIARAVGWVAAEPARPGPEPDCFDGDGPLGAPLPGNPPAVHPGTGPFVRAGPGGTPGCQEPPDPLAKHRTFGCPVSALCHRADEQQSRLASAGGGELVHVGPDLAVTCTFPFPDQPAHPLTLADLEPSAAASQMS